MKNSDFLSLNLTSITVSGTCTAVTLFIYIYRIVCSLAQLFCPYANPLSLYSQKHSVGSLHWLRPPTRNFALGLPTCWYLKTLKFALPPIQILKFALSPTQNNNTSQWNIGYVRSQTQNFCVGHVHSIFLVSISFALGPAFQWNTGLRFWIIINLRMHHYFQISTSKFGKPCHLEIPVCLSKW